MNQTILEAKQGIVNEITEKARACQAVVFFEYRGMTVAKIQELRRALRKEDAEMCVYKNSLVERACENLGVSEAKEVLNGPNAVVFSKDVINGPKIIAKYSKRLKGIVNVKGGIVEGKFATAEQVIEVSKLPGKDGVMSMFLSCLQAPIRQFACAVQAVADAK